MFALITRLVFPRFDLDAAFGPHGSETKIHRQAMRRVRLAIALLTLAVSSLTGFAITGGTLSGAVVIGLAGLGIVTAMVLLDDCIRFAVNEEMENHLIAWDTARYAAAH